MLDSEVLLPVVSQALVEGGVLLLGDLLRVTRPDGLRLVELLILDLLLLDLLCLLGLLLVIDLLDLGLLFTLIFLRLCLIILDLLQWAATLTTHLRRKRYKDDIPSRPPSSPPAEWGTK